MSRVISVRNLLLSLCLAVSLVSSATARSWRDVVDPSMYRYVDLDEHKLLVMAEADPFQTLPPPSDKGDRVSEAPPSRDGDDVAVDEATLEPTASPTAVWEMVDQNGGCPEGQLLHEIRMVDNWGDGWDDTTLTITRMVKTENQIGIVKKVTTDTGTVVSEIIPVKDPVGDDPSFPREIYKGSLYAGSEGFAYVCLELDQCYQVVASGGLWQQEVTWGIRQVQLGIPREHSSSDLILTKGRAPETCRLSVAVNGERACPVTCGLTTQMPSPAPATRVPTRSPIKSPTLSPTSAPTVVYNIVEDDVPTISPSAVPSDVPSLVPTSRPTASTFNQGIVIEEGPISQAPSDMPSVVPTSRPTEKTNGLGGLGGGFGFGFR